MRVPLYYKIKNMWKISTFRQKYTKDTKLPRPAMERSTKNNVLKVFRIAVFSNINYHSIENIHIKYKDKIFMKS